MGRADEAGSVSLTGVEAVDLSSPVPRSAAPQPLSYARAALEVGLFVLPALLAPMLLIAYLAGAYHEPPLVLDGKYFPDGGFLFDLHVMWKAGHDVVTGHSPYPFVYPAPAALLMVPFGVLPWKLAVVAFSIAVYAAAFVALRLLGVRDWRCYCAALASLPGFTAVTAGTLSWPLALGAAVVWRYRDRQWPAAVAVVGVVATKLFLWPLLIWLMATRRLKTAATTVVLGVVVVVGSWAVLGFDGLLDYPQQLSRTAGVEQTKGYSAFPLLRSLGLSSNAAHAVIVALAIVLVAGIFAATRARDGDRRAFVWALGAALVLTPIMWPHYLVLLFVVVALFRPHLSVAWIVPYLYWVLPYWVVPGPNSHLWSILIASAVTLLVALAIVARPRNGEGAPKAALASR